MMWTGYRKNDAGATILAGFLVFLLSTAVEVRSDASNHRYKAGEEIPLYVNKVGPYANPSETYRYLDFPFCKPAHVKEKSETLGGALNGDRLVNSMYSLKFLSAKETELVCRIVLSKEQVAQFRNAVAKDYYNEMYCDDLPVWTFLGMYRTEYNAGSNRHRFYLYTTLHFEVHYNNDQIIRIMAQTEPDSTAVDISEDKQVDVKFMYNVTWKKTTVPFEKRLAVYHPYSTLSNYLDDRWFSTINSCVTVLLLTGFLATILARVLKNDFVKYALDEEAAEDQEETGWKNIHGDVFRYPKYKSLLAALLGSGAQLLALTISIFILALAGMFYPFNQGALLTALVIVYALTSGIAGYTALCFYSQLEGTNWVRNLLLTGGLFFGPLITTFWFLNIVAIVYNVTAVVPFGTMAVIFLIWILVSSPLLVLGGIIGKNSKVEFQAPCPTSKIPREIPRLPWYRGTLTQMAIAGILPFNAIRIELYYVFRSMWGYELYPSYTMLFIVFVALLIVTAFVSVALTYFQLAAEDHQWWWRSFLCGGSTGLIMYGFCVYYYYVRTNMTGLMQTSFFFGYLACVCFGFFLMLGTVGFWSALFFVRHIYHSLKSE